ncbi:Maf family protein [Ruminococcus sp.]|uniref:Maf family protein n=1 Tax=Ruminococcus sp. TaxID=41978 RepID=UPI0025F9B604|nr:Maf family protein [Ruminococcus sp.]
MSVNIASELMEYDVILASASPRRKELLSLMCENFRVIPSDCDETIPADVAAELAPEYLSGIKCRCIASVYDLSVVIGCDTVVICGGKVLGKPADEADAIKMLESLSGKTHDVITGVTIGRGCRYRSFSVDTKVTFRELGRDEILTYVKSGEPMDKAGAYGIQGKGALLVEKIEGDFFNVVGLPVSRLAEEMHEFLKKVQSK